VADATRALSARFLFAHPAHAIAFRVGRGARAGARDRGTLVAIDRCSLWRWAGDTGFLLAVVALGSPARGPRATGRDLGDADHSAIVIDEIAAFC
jgi:phosphatidylglycerophosphatase A